MKFQIKSNVVNGNLKRNREQIKQAIASFEGKEIIITIDKAKKTRSNNQNNFYWGVCIPLIQSGLKDATGLEVLKTYTTIFCCRCFLQVLKLSIQIRVKF